jgi:hypothetical protein
MYDVVCQENDKLQSALTTAQEENKRYKDALIELRDVIGLDDEEYKIVESSLNGGKNE